MDLNHRFPDAEWRFHLGNGAITKWHKKRSRNRAYLSRNRKFESISLQRGVCELSVPPAGRVSGSRFFRGSQPLTDRAAAVVICRACSARTWQA